MIALEILGRSNKSDSIKIILSFGFNVVYCLFVCLAAVWLCVNF